MGDKSRAGWYPDPDGSGAQRYFDGTNWTNETPPKGLANREIPGKAVLIVIAVMALIYIGTRSNDSGSHDREVLPSLHVGQQCCVVQ